MKKIVRKLNQYRVVVEEYVKGAKPKVWTVYAKNLKEAKVIANRRIKIKEVRKK